MKILGVKINNLTYQSALDIAKKMIDEMGRHYIVTLNTEMLIAAQRDSEFKDILNRADLAVADGIGVVFAGKFLGERVIERVAGVDLLEGLVALAAEFGYNLYLLGGKEGVAEKAALALNSKYPELKISGAESGSPNSEYDRVTRSKLLNKKIDILVVAYGVPKQEKWIARNMPYLDVKLAIGVGGALDYVSGAKKRAPKWIQKVGFEWAFRLINEPWRLKRQLALPYFVFLVLKEKFAGST